MSNRKADILHRIIETLMISNNGAFVMWNPLGWLMIIIIVMVSIVLGAITGIYNECRDMYLAFAESQYTFKITKKQR